MNVYVPNIGTYSRPATIDLSRIDWRQGMLIRSSNWLGDAVMTMPAIYRLRQMTPAELGLTILCHQKLADLWESVPWVGNVIAFSKKRLDSDAKDRIKTADPGVSVILPNSFGSAWELRQLGLPNLIGRSGRGRSFLLDHKLPSWRRASKAWSFHESRNYLEIATCCGSADWGISYPSIAPVKDGVKIPALPLVTDAGASLLVVAPGAAYGPAKQWPANYFNEVCRWWAGEHGAVAAVGTAAEHRLCTDVLNNCENGVNLAGETGLADLVAILQRAECVLANDSGVMHLAASLGRRGVAVFGSTDPEATGPVGGRWIVLKQNLWCSPCRSRTCFRKDTPYECLRTIDAHTAIKAVQMLLNR